MTAMYTIYHYNPHLRIDVPDIFILSYYKYVILSMDPQISLMSIFFFFLLW